MKEFRGLRTDRLGWVYGDVIDDKYIFTRNAINSEFIDCGELTLGGVFEIIPETVGQYIGRQDKDGIKIFEGDLAKCENCTIGEVVWIKDEACYGIKFNDHTMGIYYTVRDFLKVIGNIHEGETI